MEGHTLVKLVAIISLTAIAVSAMFHGIDSVLVGAISSIIGGIAGYEIGRKRYDKTRYSGKRFR